MRLEARIPIYLKYLDKYKKELSITVQQFKDFSEYWTKYPDLRMGQALINLGVIPDDNQDWSNECTDFLLHRFSELKPRDVYFWASNYDRNGQPLKEPVYKLIKNMDSDHIEKIISGVLIEKVLKKPSLQYMKMFVEELYHR
jgi:hypothetical protein